MRIGDFCRFGHFSLGGGYNLQFTEVPNLTGYLGLRSTIMYSSDYINKWLYGAGPNLRLRLRWTDQLYCLLESWHRIDPANEYKWYKDISISMQKMFAKNWGLRLVVRDLGFDQTAEVNWLWYR